MTIAVSDKIIIPKGTYGIDLSFTVYNNDSSAYDLTDMTVTLKIWNKGISSILVVDQACSIDSATDGTCHYTIRNGDFDVPSVYEYELELTATGVIDNTISATLTVTESG